ncbi:MAG TPA: CARDB domain-containing protein, partial [Burkholderiaceae bacterium]|nr:CARDB domain-containing protein [Burkholderiaceae bacterium]
FASLGDIVDRQEESVQISVDSTPPQVLIHAPASDFVTPNNSVRISATDANAGTVKTYRSRGPNLNDWKLDAELAGNQREVSLFDLRDLEEGKYGVRVVATDLAENTTDVVKLFTIDKTAPVVSLAAPLANSYLSSRNGPIKIAGKVEETNLKQYELRFGKETTSPDLVELLSGTTLAAPAIGRDWDVSQIPDGDYVLWLHATDLAGQEGSVINKVVIDNIAPVAQLRMPADGGYVRTPGAITGVAADTNLQDYTLEIAPGAKNDANRWSLLHTATVAVNDGTLFNWRTLPVDGVYTLRLRVRDKAGAVTEAIASFTVDTLAPDTPLNLTAKLENRQDAHLAWSASTAPDVAGYAVLRNGVRINEALVSGTAYTDPALQNGNYTYAVQAVDKAGWTSTGSDPASVAVNTTGPSARIFNPLRAALVGAVVDIRGIASAPLDFKEYRVYIGNGENPSAWRLLRRSPAPVRAGTLASWDTIGVSENTPYAIKLEAEDLYGEVATETVTVTVDNTPPLAPVQLMANADGANVTLHWTASTSTDVAGYIVMRDDRIANAQGAVIGSWTPYLVTGTTHLDVNVADGVHRYVVLAMDKAENLSPPSNVASVTLDTRAPHALMQQPLANAHIGRSTYLLATSPDTDVASVQFQYQAAGETQWTNVGQAAVALPYAATLDGAAFVPGDYLLRAVATDIHGKTDPAPTAITVTFSEMPDVITDLKAKVNGGTVTLTWSSQASGLTGYVLERYDGQGVVTRIALPAQASVSYPDAELADDHYRYRVSALGASGKSNLASDDVAALVHTPLIEAPFTPTAKASFTLSGHTLAGGTLTLSNRADDGDHSAEFDNGADGSFTLTGLALPMGLSQHSLTHTDALGNVSKAARFDMRRADPPAQPTGLAAQTVGDQTVVSWNANSETDIIGYGVIRNGQAEQDNPRPQWTLVVDPADQTNAYNATDADPTTVWTPNMAGAAAAKTLHMQFNDSVVLSRASLNWAAGGAARDYDLLIPAGAGNWTVLAKVRANGEVANEVRFDSVRVTELRLQILDANGAPALAEFAFSGPHLQPATNLALTPMAHQETFAVYAVNAYGMSGAQASVVHQSSAPQADLVVAAAALVFDTPQPSVGSTVRLHIPLENKGQGAALQFGAAISALGPNGQQVALGGTEITQLDGAASTVLSGEWVPDAAGEWTITVVADSADAVAESDETNNQAVRKVTVGAAVPGAALPLQVSAPAGGAALALSWTAPGALQPAGYRIRAAAAAAGPYSAVGGVVASLDYLDTNVVNGVRRFYIVTAIDALGQVIATSAPVSGVAQDRQAPGAPLLLGPTVAGKPVVVESRQVDVVGFAEPGASVALLRGATLIGAAEASSAIAEREFGAIGSHGFDVSADGRRLVLGDDGAVIDLDSGTRTTVPSALRADQLAWSHDGRLLAMFAEEDRQLHVYSVAEDAIILRTTMRNTNFVLAWSPDDQQLLIDGTDDQDQTGLFLIDRNSGAQRLLTAGWNFDGQVSWTPDGQHIATARDGRIAVLRASDGEQVFAESRFSGAPNWSADGKRLLYEFAAGDVRQIAEFQIDGGAVRDLSDTSADRSKPLWTGIGNDFIYAEDGKAVLRPLDGDARLTVVAERYDSNRAFTTGRGELFYRKDGRLHRMTLAGQFRMANVDLLDGENVFTATAADKAGNVSAAALPISVTHAAGAIADLAASEQDLTVLPAAPLVGEATRLGISVRNIGTAPASAVGVSVALRSPAGKTSVLHQSVMAQVNAGASEVISLDWTPAETGEYTLALSLDAGATVAESNERNNVALRTIGVAANALPTLAVSTERANYGANAALAGKATLFNPGAQVSGALVLRIEDADG